MTKIEKAILYVKAQAGRLSPYVWGGQGQKLKSLTLVKLAQMEQSPEDAGRVAKFVTRNLAKYDKKKSKIFDCSGLIICALIYAGLLPKGYDDTANGLMNYFKTAISPAARKPGDLVFKVKNGHAYHVGILVDPDNVAEARGRDYGVCITPFNSDWGVVKRVA